VTARPQIVRHLPGRATQRDFMGRIKFFRATVIHVSEFSIGFLPEGKMLGLQRLIGETYIYQCTFCTTKIDGKSQATSVWETERIKSKGACPHCGHQLEYLKAGQTLRIHFRALIIKNADESLNDQSSATWWGERYDW
jgi:DNA-directed RNA polymerase subunit RPC12/RpoP